MSSHPAFNPPSALPFARSARSARPTRRRPRLKFPISAAREPPPRIAIHTVDRLRARAASLKCPFWRRRFGDVLDGTRQALVWAIVARHKSLPLPLPPPTTRLPSLAKTPNLALDARLALLRDDFVERQYYVTGRLSACIYADECVFDGPDPDVPVTGLAKYVSAAAGLFDRRLSRVDLLGIEERGEREIVARWRLEGALNLPWKPRIKPYTGETTYTFDEQGLVVRHVETWSVSALDAFVSVIWPGFGEPPAPPVEELMKAMETGEGR